MKVRPRVVLLVRLVLACWILQETRNTYTASTWQMNGRSQLALFDYSVVAVDILPNRKNETVHVQHLKRKHPQTENSDDPSEPDYEFSSEYQQAETATIQQLPNFQLGLPDLAEMAKAHIEPVSNVTAAICFKTLFGDIDIGIVIQWAGTFV